MDNKRKEEIRENYLRVCEKIENAKAHRHVGEGEVTLLAATKTVPAEEILFAVNELGLPAVGENYPQEFNEKYEELKGTVPLHLIGHLQTNKVKTVIGKADMIQSVDSIHLAKEIAKRSEAQNIVTDILCEINIGEEENKSGFLPREVSEAIDEISEMSGIKLCGLMTMAPICEKNDEYRKYFEKTYGLYLDFLSKKSHNRIEYILSMGMSDSFEVAVEEGANMVRVGSSIFGKRFYPQK